MSKNQPPVWAFRDEKHFFQTFDDSKEKRPHLISTLNGTVEEHSPALSRLNEQGAGIFYAVNECQGKRHNNHVVRIRAVFLDLDEPDPNRIIDQYKVEPSLVVESSAGKHHMYWFVNDLPVKDFKAFQKALAKDYGGDPKVNDPARVMRVPGYYNLKDPDNPFLVRIVGGNGKTYAREELEKLIPEVNNSSMDPKPELSDISDLIGATVSNSIDEGVAEYISKLVEELRNTPEGCRNPTLNRVAFECFSLVKARRANQGEVRREIFAAAIDTGLGANEIEATMASAWRGAKPDHSDYTKPTADDLPTLEDIQQAPAEPVQIDGNPFSHVILDDEKIASMEAQLDSDKFVMPGIAILGQTTALYARPNTGKTLLTMWLIKKGLEADKTIDGDKIIYVNADDTFKGLYTKAKIAKEAGFHMCEPSQFGHKNSEILKVMARLIQARECHGWVIVLDTLKKFTSLMDKRTVSVFTELARAFTKNGGTLILLAHVNKKRDSDGNLVYGGTSDIVDDVDCVYIIDIEKEDENTREVVFKMDKNRGPVESRVYMSYSRRIKRNYVMLFDSVNRLDSDVVELPLLSQVHKSYLEEVKKISEIIENAKHPTLKVITDLAMKDGLSMHRTRMIVDKYTGVIWAKKTGLPHNKHDYYLL